MKKDNQILCVSFHKMQQKITGGGGRTGGMEFKSEVIRPAKNLEGRRKILFSPVGAMHQSDVHELVCVLVKQTRY